MHTSQERKSKERLKGDLSRPVVHGHNDGVGEIGNVAGVIQLNSLAALLKSTTVEKNKHTRVLHCCLVSRIRLHKRIIDHQRNFYCSLWVHIRSGIDSLPIYSSDKLQEEDYIPINSQNQP